MFFEFNMSTNGMFFKIALWLTNIPNECLGTSDEILVPLRSALRVRFSDDIFQQLSRVVGILLFLPQSL